MGKWSSDISITEAAKSIAQKGTDEHRGVCAAMAADYLSEATTPLTVHTMPHFFIKDLASPDDVVDSLTFTKDSVKAWLDERGEDLKLTGAKSVNQQLKTIGALSEALTGGLTGKHSKDAGVVLAALAEKGVVGPACQKTLTGYLEQAHNL